MAPRLDAVDATLRRLCSLQVFETSGLKAVKKFLGEGKNEIFQQGRKDGWLTGKWRENYFASAAASEPTHAVAETLRRAGAPTSGGRRPARRRSSKKGGASASARTASACPTRTG